MGPNAGVTFDPSGPDPCSCLALERVQHWEMNGTWYAVKGMMVSSKRRSGT